jgi:hypothetical protein
VPGDHCSILCIDACRAYAAVAKQLSMHCQALSRLVCGCSLRQVPIVWWRRSTTAFACGFLAPVACGQGPCIN